MSGLPSDQTSVKNRSAVAEAEIIERPVNARGGRHPVRSEIENDVRAVRNAQPFENGDELLDGRELQHQGHSMIVGSGDAFIFEELRAGNVAFVVIFLVADLEQHEGRILEVVGEPIDSDQHGLALHAGRSVGRFLLSGCDRAQEEKNEQRDQRKCFCRFIHRASLSER
jgi:hypothetical protein